MTTSYDFAAHLTRFCRALRGHGLLVGPSEAADAVRDWARRLEDALVRTAARHHAVLLPRTAVAAGAPDLTAEVRAALQAPPPEDDPFADRGEER